MYISLHLKFYVYGCACDKCKYKYIYIYIYSGVATTELGVQKYGKIPYFPTPPDPDSARIRILFYNQFWAVTRRLYESWRLLTCIYIIFYVFFWDAGRLCIETRIIERNYCKFDYRTREHAIIEQNLYMWEIWGKTQLWNKNKNYRTTKTLGVSWE